MESSLKKGKIHSLSIFKSYPLYNLPLRCFWLLYFFGILDISDGDKDEERQVDEHYDQGWDMKEKE